MKSQHVFSVIVGVCALNLTGCGQQSDSANEQAESAKTQTAKELVVYSARNEQLIQPLIAEYQAQRGIKVKLVTAKAGPLLERIKAEGANSPADILLTVDAGNLWQAAQSGLLSPLDSAALLAAIPAHLRDPEQQWFGLSVRARTIVHHPDRAPADSLSTYEALAESAFKGRLCLRTSKKVYNQSLVAMLIAEHGEARTEEIVKGWVANLAAPPFSNDTAVMNAIAAGQCDVGIVNTYYFGRLQKADPNYALRLFWPNQNGSGVHVNVSGGAVVQASDAPVQAQTFLEWLAAGEAQSLFAAGNMEYPANASVASAKAVQAWGSFKPNIINVAEAGRLQAAAVKLMDRAGYQ
ncbi:MAG: extracellular solute-binding protein [Oceanococcus sp.]|nr:MAG: extracellular solute-binding protein [Oceanococcus sp.]